MLSHVLAHTWQETWTNVMLEGKSITKVNGVCIIQVFIAWVVSVSSRKVIFHDLNTPTEWGLHDLDELHICVNLICICRD